MNIIDRLSSLSSLFHCTTTLTHCKSEGTEGELYRCTHGGRERETNASGQFLITRQLQSCLNKHVAVQLNPSLIHKSIALECSALFSTAWVRLFVNRSLYFCQCAIPTKDCMKYLTGFPNLILISSLGMAQGQDLVKNGLPESNKQSNRH